MPVTPELVEQVSRLTPAELNELLTRVGGDDAAARFPRIRRTPNVCGGSARLGNTRIPVWGVEAWRRLGLSDDDILTNYPSLEPADLAAAWEYVAANRVEIDEEIRRNEEA